MIKIKEILNRSKEVDGKAEEVSNELSKHDYTITEKMLATPMNTMYKILRRMGFNKEQAEQIINDSKKELIGKEMHKGDNFHALMQESFTKSIEKVIKSMKEKKNV